MNSTGKNRFSAMAFIIEFWRLRFIPKRKYLAHVEFSSSILCKVIRINRLITKFPFSYKYIWCAFVPLESKCQKKDLTVSPKRLGKTLRVTKKSRKAARRNCQVARNTRTRSDNSTFSRSSGEDQIMIHIYRGFFLKFSF